MDIEKAHHHTSALRNVDPKVVTESREVANPTGVQVKILPIDIFCQDKAMAVKLQADVDRAIRSALEPIVAWHKSQVAAALES